MLTGRLPFAADTPVALLVQRLQVQPMPPDRGRPDLNISLDVSKLVMEAIEKERENRYRSAEEMERAIAAVLEGRRAERERRERERVETARLAAAEAERGRQERAKAEAARLAAERTERERVQREAAEATRRTAEGAERERLQQETVAQASQAQRDRVGPPGPEHKESATTVLGRRELSRRWRIGYGIAAGALALVGFFVARSLTEKPAQDIAGIQVVPYRPAGASKMNPKDGLRYVWVPPGKFTMGCSAGDSDCGGYEKPAHQVTITKGFWLGQTEVTQAPYQRVVGTNSSYFKGADLPVEEVSWDQAQAYCQAIGGRLPTEAEWEYAARAGSVQSRYGDIDRIAWYYGNSGGHTHEVAQKEANAWGLYDMLGNVWEWTADWYGGYAPGSAVDPAGPVSGQSRALRGGAWNNGPRYARVSYCSRLEPGNRNNNIGLRCARE